MKKILRNRQGSVSLELCLVMPTLLVMMIGIYDFGFLFFEQSQVDTAAHAGSLYAWKLGTSGFNAAKIGNAVTGAAYPVTVSATPAPYTACACPNGTTSLAQATCGSPCPDGTSAGSYAVVTAQATPAPIFPWPGMPAQVKSAVVVPIQ